MPNYLGHPDNYIPADPLKTPSHIVPEWYFLPFYAILRAITFNIGPIDSKLGGVLAMFGSIALLFLVPWLDTSKVRSAVYRPLVQAVLLDVRGQRDRSWLARLAPCGRRLRDHVADRHALLLRLLPGHHAGARPDRNAAKRLPNSITEAVLAKEWRKAAAGGIRRASRRQKPAAEPACES